jgi:hypothetical protein
VLNPHSFAFVLKDMKSSTWHVVDFRLLLVILGFENFLPPWSLVLLDLGGKNGVIGDEASFLHVLIYPFESVVIALDLNRAVESFPYL